MGKLYNKFIFLLLLFFSCQQKVDNVAIENYFINTKDTLFLQSYYFIQQNTSDVKFKQLTGNSKILIENHY
jgi:hypothetical protein